MYLLQRQLVNVNIICNHTLDTHTHNYFDVMFVNTRVLTIIFKAHITAGCYSKMRTCIIQYSSYINLTHHSLYMSLCEVQTWKNSATFFKFVGLLSTMCLWNLILCTYGKISKKRNINSTSVPGFINCNTVHPGLVTTATNSFNVLWGGGGY